MKPTVRKQVSGLSDAISGRQDTAMTPTLWTIGHSTRPIDEFLELLKTHRIQQLVDVRTVPRSRHNPQFDTTTLAKSVRKTGLTYRHMPALGGLRKAKKDSINTGWRNISFRGYADYMQTYEFKNAMEELQAVASKQTTAYMCSEAVWWSCHRALVSDYLKIRGWTVMHIMGVRKEQEHPYTKAASIVNGKLQYGGAELF